MKLLHLHDGASTHLDKIKFSHTADQKFQTSYGFSFCGELVFNRHIADDHVNTEDILVANHKELNTFKEQPDYKHLQVPSAKFVGSSFQGAESFKPHRDCTDERRVGVASDFSFIPEM